MAINKIISINGKKKTLMLRYKILESFKTVASSVVLWCSIKLNFAGSNKSNIIVKLPKSTVNDFLSIQLNLGRDNIFEFFSIAINLFTIDMIVNGHMYYWLSIPNKTENQSFLYIYLRWL